MRLNWLKRIAEKWWQGSLLFLNTPAKSGLVSGRGLKDLMCKNESNQIVNRDGSLRGDKGLATGW